MFKRQLYQSKLGFHTNTDEINAETHFRLGIIAFFLNRDYVYFVRGDSELIAVSRWTGKVKTIASLPIGTELSFDGRYITYQISDGETVQYDSKTQKVR